MVPMFRGKPLVDGRYGLVVDYLYDTEEYTIIVRITDAATLVSKDTVICGDYEWILRKNNFNMDICVRQILNNLYNQVTELGIDHRWINYNRISRCITETLQEIMAEKGWD